MADRPNASAQSAAECERLAMLLENEADRQDEDEYGPIARQAIAVRTRDMRRAAALLRGGVQGDTREAEPGDGLLLPCPFCGLGCDHVHGPCPNYGIRKDRGEQWFVTCCVVQTDDFPTIDEAIAAWNRRAALRPVVPASAPDDLSRFSDADLSNELRDRCVLRASGSPESKP